MHFSRIGSFADTACLYAGVDYSAPGYLAECAACGVVRGVGMGVTESRSYAFPDRAAQTPMPCDLPDTPPSLAVCLGINPYTLDGNAAARIKTLLRARGQPDAPGYAPPVCGFKIYPGYYPFHAGDPVYEPVYELAAENGLPVVIHAGDTFSERGLLVYARPFYTDRLAVRRRDVRFVIAHMGDPWVMEACEVAYKNPNVFIDLSGLAVGGADEIARIRDEPLLRDHFRRGLVYLNRYERVLYGSDWPLVPMAAYITLCRTLVPEVHWPAVFYGNAAALFGLA